MGVTKSLPFRFRQQCEAIATEQRSLLRLRAFDPLPADALAAKLGAIFFTPDQFPNADQEQVAKLLASKQWSAAVICYEPLWIIHNPNHAPTRRESNLMHELAHVLLKHEMVGFDSQTGLPKRRDNDEKEAEYLGSCLQIPHRGLLWATQRGMSLPQIAEHFGASEQMVQFRRNVTGVNIV